MKTKLIYSVIAAAVIMAMSGCTQESVVNSDTPTVMNASIHVSDQAFQSVDGTTRATNSGVSTTFVDGDAIGIFIVKNGAASVTNEKYTYHNGAWYKSTGSATISYDADAKYFAYYPYQADMTNKYTLAATTSADDFFAGLISGWTLTKDFTGTNYDAQDLMVSMGTASKPSDNTVEYSFTMNHKMALVEFQYPQTVVTDPNDATYSRATYTWLDDYKPYNLKNGCYRILVNPLTAYSFRGKEYETFSFTEKQAWSASVTNSELAANAYKVFKNAAGDAASYTEKNLLVGDVYFSDGTWSRNTVSDKTPIGIVVSTDPTYCEKAYNTKFGHGLVMALNNASDETNNYISGHETKSPAWCTAASGKSGTSIMTNLTNTVGNMILDASGMANFAKVTVLGATYTEANFPAFWLAANYTPAAPVDVTTTGWFLPSMGQWYEAVKNAYTYYNANSGETHTITFPTSDADKAAGYYRFTGQAAKMAAEMSYLFSSKTSLTATDFSNYNQAASKYAVYWSSSEYSTTNACSVYWGSDGNVTLYSDIKTTMDYRYVRPFLAF